MDIGSLAAREQIARERIERAADVLAQRFGLADLAAAVKGANNRDVRVAAMMRMEKIADLLEGLVTEIQRPPVLDEPLIEKRKPGPFAGRKGG